MIDHGCVVMGIDFEWLDKFRPEIPDYAPGEMPVRMTRIRFIILPVYLHEISFYLVEVVFAAEPAKELKRSFWWINFHIKRSQPNEIFGICW